MEHLNLSEGWKDACSDGGLQCVEGDCLQGVEVDGGLQVVEVEGGLQGVEVDWWPSMFEVGCYFGSRKELGERVGHLLSGEFGKGVALWFKISLG